MDVTLERAAERTSEASILLADGTEIPIRLRLLGYDGCEFECDRDFDAGEQVSIRLYRMGCIRTRIVSSTSGVVEAEFDKHCPV